MQLQFFIYIIPLFLAPVISVMIGLYIWRQRHHSASGATWLGLLTFATAWWGICYLIQILVGAELQTLIFWNTLRQVGANTVAVFLFLFVLEYTGRKDRAPARVIWGLFSIAFISILLAFTNEVHHLYWPSYQLIQSGPFQLLAVTRGAVNLVYILFSYLLILLSTILLFQWMFSNTQRLYSRQIFAFAIAVLAPSLSNFLFVTGIIPIDLTPFTFSITALGFAFAIFQFRILDIAPVARELIIEKMNDGVIVLDTQNRIVDINPAAQLQTGLEASEIIGKNADTVFPIWSDILQQKEAGSSEITIGDDENKKWLELIISPLNDKRNNSIGNLLVLRDITKNKIQETALRKSEEKYRRIYEHLADVLYQTDFHGVLTDISPSIQKQTGYTQEEIIGRNITSFYAFLEDYEALVAVILEKGSVNDFEVRLKQKDESIVFVSVTVHTVFDSNGQPIGTEGVMRNITERKQAEKQLHMQSVALESAANAIVISDINGEIEWVNPAFTHLTGYTAQEAIGKPTNLLKSGRHDQAFYKNLWDTVNAGKAWQGELTNRRKNGSLYEEEQTITPVLDETGKVSRFIAIKQDVTEQRMAREQLEKQNAYLSVLHQITLDLLNRRNPADLFQAIVDRAATLLDAPYVEFDLVEGDELVVSSTTKNQSNLIGERTTREQSKLSWQAHDTGEPAVLDDYGSWSGQRTEITSYTRLYATADFPVMVNNKCIAILALGRDKPEHIFTAEEIQTGILFSRLLGLVLDNVNLYDLALKEISERKRTEYLLQESEARFRQIVESASDIIYRTDAQGRFTYFNPTAMKIFGFTDESQVLGRHFLELTAPVSRDELKRFYRKQIANREQTTYQEFVATAAGGQEIWLGQNVQLILSGDQPAGFQAVARDITKLKQAYEALFIARDQAVEASQLKSQLLARVSHELRTPLSGVLGYAELLHYDAFGQLAEEQKNATQQIMASANYLTSIINDLLDEAQIETRSVVLKREQFSPAAMLSKVETTMSVLAQNKGLELKTNISPDMPTTLTGDAQRLQQIIINLAGNAIKFTSKGEVRINLLHPNSTQWAIQVSDTGVGIPEEAKYYIFEPFRQIDNSITRENRGSGLGLSITKQLVELMGGEISLQSEIGHGSTFTITLPIQKNTEKKK